MRKIKIGALSDLHGNYPDPTNFEEVDLFVLAGDNLPDFVKDTVARQRRYFEDKFLPFLREIKATMIVITGANHDHLFQDDPNWINEVFSEIPDGRPSIHLINFGQFTYRGRKCFASAYSYQPPTYPYRWSFGQSEEGLGQLWEQIPEDTEILVSHTPPLGALDFGFSGSQMMNFGSSSLLRYLNQESFPLPNLKLLITAHVHEHGNQSIVWRHKSGHQFVLANAAADKPYTPEQRVSYFEI